MTLSSRITRTAARVCRVHGAPSDADRRRLELSPGMPAPRPTRPTREGMPLSGQHLVF